MVLVTPPPVIVIVPVLLVIPVFAETFIVRIPFPVPPVGETVSHVALLVAVQDTFDVTVTVAFLAYASDDQVDVETVRFGETDPAACMTVMVLVIPPPVTDIVPVRSAAVLFGMAISTSEPSPVPIVP